MILRVERIDNNSSITFAIDKIPEYCSAISFEGKFYQVINVIDFVSHKLVLVKEMNVLKLYPSQILGVDDE